MTASVPVSPDCRFATLMLGNVTGGPVQVTWRATFESSILTNGTVQIGVAPMGQLIVPGGSPSAWSGTTEVGIRRMVTQEEGLSADYHLAEGWGISAVYSPYATYGSVETGLGSTGSMRVKSFTASGATATSVVENAAGPLVVQHSFAPSTVVASLYVITVDIENNWAVPVHAVYRRVMDWDIEPTPGTEYVTIGHGAFIPPELTATTDNASQAPNPLVPPGGARQGYFTDGGPGDEGATFDIDLGILAPGQTVQFTLFYGVAPDEAWARADLAAVNAQVWCLAESSLPGGPNRAATTFMFGFTMGGYG